MTGFSKATEQGEVSEDTDFLGSKGRGAGVGAFFPPLAMWSLFAATGFGIAGFVVSPTGEVHDSVLWLIAQFLLFTSGALGLGAVAQSINNNMRKVDQKISRLDANTRKSYDEDSDSAVKRE